jgi:hypothetical protein
LITREAVVRDTPANLAISSNVNALRIFLFLFGSAPGFHLYFRERFQSGHGEKRVKSGEKRAFTESKIEVR